MRILLLVAILAVYMPLVGGAFVWDDHLLIVENTLTESLSNIPAMFMTDLWSTTPLPDNGAGYYRPLMLVDLAITRLIADFSPHAHHLHNLVWHGVAVLLLMNLLGHLLKDSLAAVMGAAVFALHPVQLEVVGFVSARNDPMAVSWLLLALLLLSTKAPSRAALVAGAVACFAAMLSKESVVFGTLLLAFASRARWGGWGTRGAHIAVFVGFAGALSCRLAAGVAWPDQADPEQLAIVGGPALAFYLEKLIWPLDVAPVIHLAWSPALPWLAVALAIVLLVALAIAGGPLAQAGLGFAFLGLLPAWVAVAHVGAVVDRYLYLPMVGIAWAAGAIARRPIGRKCVLVAVSGLTFLSIRQVPVWESDATLWQACIERAPSGYAKGALARWLEDEGLNDDAAFWYREAVIQEPRPFEHSCFNITRIHLKRGDAEAAIINGLEALEMGCEPTPELIAPLALAHGLAGQWEEAHRRASSVNQDPTGKAQLARISASTALGDVGPLREALSSATPSGREQIRAQVLSVLQHGGADPAAITAVTDGTL